MSGSKKMFLFEIFFWLVAGVSALVLSFTFNDPIPLYRYGANTWPAIIATALIICAVIHFLYTGIQRKFLFTKDTEESVTKLSPKLLAVFIIPIIYVVSLDYLGFYFSTLVFVPLYSYVIGNTSLVKTLIVCLPATILIIVIFTKFLFVPFPVGRIELFYNFNNIILNILY